MVVEAFGWASCLNVRACRELGCARSWLASMREDCISKISTVTIWDEIYEEGVAACVLGHKAELPSSHPPRYLDTNHLGQVRHVSMIARLDHESPYRRIDPRSRVQNVGLVACMWMCNERHFGVVQKLWNIDV